MWSDVPCDLLLSIVKFTTAKDQVVLKSVCSKWGTLLSDHKCRTCSDQEQLPWLLIPSQNPRCEFYSISDGKFYPVDIPEAFVYRCCGSSNGWLVMCSTAPDLFMLNPITRSRIELPPVTTFPHVLEYRPSLIRKEYLWHSPYQNSPIIVYSGRYMEKYWMEKVILTGNPSIDDDFTALAIYSPDGNLGYCRKRDEKWTYLEATGFGFDDVVYWKGLFYGITRSESLVQIDLNGPVSVMETKLNCKITGLYSISALSSKNYIVVCSGQLLLIVRSYRVEENKNKVATAENQNHGGENHIDEDEDNEEFEEEEEFWENMDDLPEYTDVPCYFKTGSFRMYEPDFERQTWKRVRSIGDQALFIGHNNALSFKAKDFPGCRPNHIYFGNDDRSPGFSWEQDFRVMDLETSKIEPLFPGCSELTQLLRPTPLWMTPSL